MFPGSLIRNVQRCNIPHRKVHGGWASRVRAGPKKLRYEVCSELYISVAGDVRCCEIESDLEIGGRRSY
jgi:hypothetical protein